MKKSKNYFYGFGCSDVDLVWGRLIYEKVSLLTSLQAQKSHMVISDDLKPLGLPEGSTGHFWPQNDKNAIFEKKAKVMCEMWDMVMYGLETETTHPNGLFETLLFLDFWKKWKKLGGIYYCFLPKNGRFPYKGFPEPTDDIQIWFFQKR